LLAIATDDDSIFAVYVFEEVDPFWHAATASGSGLKGDPPFRMPSNAVAVSRSGK